MKKDENEMKRNENEMKMKQMEWKWNDEKTKGKENERLLVMKTRIQQTKKIKNNRNKATRSPHFQRESANPEEEKNLGATEI